MSVAIPMHVGECVCHVCVPSVCVEMHVCVCVCARTCVCVCFHSQNSSRDGRITQCQFLIWCTNEYLYHTYDVDQRAAHLHHAYHVYTMYHTHCRLGNIMILHCGQLEIRSTPPTQALSKLFNVS